MKTIIKLLGLAVGVWVAVYSVNPPEVYAQTIQVIRADGGFIGTASNKIQCLSSMECGISRGAVTLWADAGTSAASAELDLTNTTAPTTPAANHTTVSALDIGPGSLLAQMDENGVLLPFIGAGPFWRCYTYQFTYGLGYGSFASYGASGVTTAPTSTNFYTSNNAFTAYNSTAGINNAAGFRDGTTLFVPAWRGNAAGLGGFWYYSRFGIGSADTDQRFFTGLYGTAGNIAGNIDPDSLLNTVYVGCNAADSNLSVCTNDGTGTATCTGLGASFPCKTQYAVYDVFFYAPPNGSSIGYLVKRMDSAATASGTISSDLPTSTTFLRWQQWCSSGPTGAGTFCTTTNYTTCTGLR